MNQLTEQGSLFEMPAITRIISDDVVLVETKPKPTPKQDTVGPGNPGLAARFEEMADKMQVQIDAKLDPDRLTNTHKRMRQAASARAEGKRLERTQSSLRTLARMHRAGDCADFLAKLKSKKAVYELMGSRWEMGGSDYIDTGEPREDASRESRALWAFLNGPTPEQEKADRIAQLVRDLQFSKIPGYFPTPPAVIELMLDYAQIEAHHTILEPSAGAGHIIDAIVARHGDGPLIAALEINPSLCEILQAKGFDARPIDFIEDSLGKSFMEGHDIFDRVLMNPPFEKLQDIDHVQAAFERLKSGGRLISVMSPSPFFRDTKKAVAFRDWLSKAGGEVIELPEGSFKEAGTGVSSRLIVVDKA